MDIDWTRSAERDVRRLGRKLQKRIVEAVERFAAEGHGDVTKLQGEPGYRLRVGDWRVRFEVDGGTLRVMRIRPRGDAYKK